MVAHVVTAAKVCSLCHFNSCVTNLITITPLNTKFNGIIACSTYSHVGPTCMIPHDKFFSPLDLFYILLLHRLPGFVIALLCILIDFSYPNKPIFFSPFSLLMKCVPVSFSLLMKCTSYIIRINVKNYFFSWTGMGGDFDWTENCKGKSGGSSHSDGDQDQ